MLKSKVGDNMKKIILVFCLLLLCACKTINSVSEPYVINYLKKSYGEEKEFRFSSEAACDLYNLGYCSAYYQAGDLEEDVYVVWYDGDGLDMRDDYLFKKYKSDIKRYYTNYFSNTIYNRYNVEVLSAKTDYLWKKDAKANDILNYENLNLSLKIDIIANDTDTTGLGETLKNLINQRKVKNVSSLYLTTFKQGCNLNETDKCKKVNSSYIEVKITEDEPKSK